MTFTQARNLIVTGLEAHVGCQVNLSDQIAERPSYPYCYYSVLAPYISNHYFGLNEIEPREDGMHMIRSEPVSATMSFTFCSENRETEDGYIFGEDGALALAKKARAFFLLNARCISTPDGDIVVNNVTNVTDRTGFLVEDTVRRYGFDIKFSYINSDEMPTTTIKFVSFPGEVY